MQKNVKLRPPGAMRLRMRDHDYELPAVKFDLNKQNFIVRSLFHYVLFVSCFYCHCAVSLFKCYSVNMCDCYV